MLLKPEDITYFEKLQRDYDNTISYYKDVAEFMKGWIPAIKTNKYFLSETGFKYDIEHEIECTSINKTTLDFIKTICSYMRNTYGLSALTNFYEDKIHNKYVKYTFSKYNNDGLNYKQIIDDICSVLNISDFGSVTIDNLRDRIKNKWKYYIERKEIKLSKNKLKIINGGIRVEEGWDNRCSLHSISVNAITDLLSAYNYVSTGNISVTTEIKELLNSLNNYHSIKYSDFFITHPLNFIGVTDMTFYKNRNLLFRFHSDEERDKFYKIIKGEF